MSFTADEDATTASRWSALCLKGLLVSVCITATLGCQGPAADLEAAIKESLDELLHASYQNASRSERAIAGVSAAVVLPGGTTVTIVDGFADRDHGVAMADEAVFLSGSIGKTYVAAVAFSLAHEGLLSMDDKVQAWLADRAWYSTLPNANSMRIRDLVRHRSGLPHHLAVEKMFEFYGSMFDAGPEVQVSPGMILSQMGGEQPLFEPGKGYQYSDLNYLLLGLVIEAAAGGRYFTVLRDRFLDPLGLHNSFVQIGPDIPRLAAGYLAEDFPFDIPSPTVVDGQLVYNPAFEWTGGGLATTSSDLARWAWLLLSGRAMEWDYLVDMLERPSEVSGTPNTYAAGVRLFNDMDAFALGHGGAMPGYQSYALYFPACDVAIAMQVNDDQVDWALFRVEFVNQMVNTLSTEFGFHCR